LTDAKRSAALWALVAAALFAGWQELTVLRNFDGNWTALFCTGNAQPIPPSLRPGTYLVSSSTGYDGQMYRYVAHDPFLTGEAHRYLDNSALRTNRILIPGLAWLLALGNQSAIDTVYILLFPLACFAGAYWIALYLNAHSVSPSCCLLFLLVPATLTATDRLVVDLPFCALTAAVVWYDYASKCNALFAALLLACLCRETGFILLAAFVASELFERHWRRAIRVSAAALPTLAWYFFVHYQLASSTKAASGWLPGWLGKVDSIGPYYRLLHPFPYPFVSWVAVLAQSFDRLAILGMLLSFVLALWYGLRQPKEPVHLAALLFAGSAALTLDPEFWQETYNFVRPFSPLLLIVALHSATVTRHRWLWLLPAAMVDLRICFQLSPQILGVFGIHVARW